MVLIMMTLLNRNSDKVVNLEKWKVIFFSQKKIAKIFEDVLLMPDDITKSEIVKVLGFRAKNENGSDQIINHAYVEQPAFCAQRRQWSLVANSERSFITRWGRKPTNKRSDDWYSDLGCTFDLRKTNQIQIINLRVPLLPAICDKAGSASRSFYACIHPNVTPMKLKVNWCLFSLILCDMIWHVESRGKFCNT